MRNYSYNIAYRVDNKKYICNSTKCEHFKLDVKEENNVLSLSVLPKCSISFDKFDIIFPYSYNASDKIFVNGYQSWTDSFEYEPNWQMKELSRSTEFYIKYSFGKSMGLSKSGDNNFWKFPRKAGIFYGWSYGYVRNDNNVNIFGATELYS